METPLISTWSNGTTVPPKYVFPANRRPNHDAVVSSPRIPLIELEEEENQDWTKLVRKIVRATEEFGVFEVKDHGVSKKVMDETRKVTKQFFALPAKEKMQYYSTNTDRRFILYTSSINYDQEALHYWRDAARHHCNPIQQSVRYWPEKPRRYRETVKRYVDAVSTLGSRILELLGEGLGLEPGYFNQEHLCEDPIFTVNHYPQCPEPSSTWGFAEHYDPGLMTILLQDDAPGLQAFHQGKWISIDPSPYSFIINAGNLLEIVTNGRLKSVKHRVLTNASKPRTTATLFLGPKKSCTVQAAKSLVSSDNPPLYRAVQFEEVLGSLQNAFMGELDCAMEAFMESIKLK
ncbi:hypothetical protein vseg_003261 [Gypsophila vaccaria]